MTLNSQGHLVGNSMTSSANSLVNIWQNSPGTDHAVYFSMQTGTVALQTLNGTAGLPMGINNSDQIVGESYTPEGTIHGFLTKPGASAIDLNTLIGIGSGYTILAGIKIDD
jgi:probable HAF family extracellular repeat protein